MLNDEICTLREKLNNAIDAGQDYMIIYKLSIELDELIAKYYRELKEEKKHTFLRLKKNKGKIVLNQKS